MRGLPAHTREPGHRLDVESGVSAAGEQLRELRSRRVALPLRLLAPAPVALEPIGDLGGTAASDLVTSAESSAHVSTTLTQCRGGLKMGSCSIGPSRFPLCQSLASPGYGGPITVLRGYADRRNRMYITSELAWTFIASVERLRELCERLERLSRSVDETADAKRTGR